MVIEQNHIAAFEGKGLAPVAADVGCPMSRQISLQWMQVPAWQIDIPRTGGPIEDRQLSGELSSMSGLNASFVAMEKEALKAFVPERFDH